MHADMHESEFAHAPSKSRTAFGRGTERRRAMRAVPWSACALASAVLLASFVHEIRSEHVHALRARGAGEAGDSRTGRAIASPYLPAQRLRGGWANPLSSDVLAHPVPDLETRHVPKFLLPSPTSPLPSTGSKWGLRAWLGRRKRQVSRKTTKTSANLKTQQLSIVHTGGGMIRGSAAELNSVCQCIVVEASVAECFAAASGFEDYPKWAGAIQSLQVLEPAQGSTPATLVEWTMGMFGITTKNKMRYSYELPGAIRIAVVLCRHFHVACACMSMRALACTPRAHKECCVSCARAHKRMFMDAHTNIIHGFSRVCVHTCVCICLCVSVSVSVCF
jgi:hypothetical protein